MDKNARAIIGGVIDRDPLGRLLTPQAREQAVTNGVAAWKRPMGNGDAAQIGIQTVTSGILKDK